MGIAYSVDLRARVVGAYDEGVTISEVEQRYRVSRRTVYRLLKRRRETGSIEPKPRSGGTEPKLAAHVEQVKEIVAQQPDATLEELRETLGIRVGISTIWRLLRDLKLTLKKSPSRRGTASA